MPVINPALWEKKGKEKKIALRSVSSGNRSAVPPIHQRQLSAAASLSRTFNSEPSICNPSYGGVADTSAQPREASPNASTARAWCTTKRAKNRQMANMSKRGYVMGNMCFRSWGRVVCLVFFFFLFSLVWSCWTDGTVRFGLITKRDRANVGGD